MNTKKRLILSQAALALVVIVAYGLIIVNEKKEVILRPRAEAKINNYIKDNYSKLNLKKSKLTYNNDTFKIRLTSPTNNKLYFYITYKDKKIKDTYKKDYLEGRTLLNSLSKSMEDEIYKKTNTKYKVIFTSKLNNYRDIVQKEILKENNLLNLKIYYLENEEIINYNYIEITNDIINKMNTNTLHNITPSYYNFIITNKTDITQSNKIKLTNSFITNPNNNQIIYNLINK